MDIAYLDEYTCVWGEFAGTRNPVFELAREEPDCGGVRGTPVVGEDMFQDIDWGGP
jgi:hypothetical protein